VDNEEYVSSDMIRERFRVERPKIKQLGVRVTPDMKSTLDRLADEHGVTISRVAVVLIELGLEAYDAKYRK